MQVDAMVSQAVLRMRKNAFGRDEAMDMVRAVRDGRFADVWPDSFSERYPTSIVANFVDIACRDLAANLSPLPALNCSAGRMRTDADRRRAEKKNRIGFSFWLDSRLEFQMKYGADQYLSYGFLPFYVDIDRADKCLKIRVLDPQGCYYELNRNLETKRFAQCWTQDADELAAMFPEYASLIVQSGPYGQRRSGDLEVVQYVDDTQVILYLPAVNGLVLGAYLHGLGFCPVHVALRPGLHANPRGQFDDVLYVQLAHTVMAALTLEAGHKAVQAPIVVTPDMTELGIGPDALMVAEDPQKIGRLQLNVPAAAFTLGESLREEMKEGAGYPDTRLGVGPAGGSTGRGVSALEGGFDSQIKQGQDVLGLALKTITEMCFRIEMLLWPNKQRTVTGVLSGESFELTYTPKKDIGDNPTCAISYGFASGSSPNSAIVTLLQLRGDGIIDRNTFRRQLPLDLDVDAIQRELDIQEIEDALKQALAASLQATGQMIAQGQMAEAMQFFSVAHQLAMARRDGVSLIDGWDQAWQQVQAQQQQAAEAQAAQQQAAPAAGGAPGGAPGGDPLAGVAPSGLPQGVAPGQAGLPPGGRPSIQDLTASFTSGGAPALGAGIRRRVPTG